MTRPLNGRRPQAMPAKAEPVPLHYVGYTTVGEVQMASISTLQKPLLHLYAEFLKTGGCTARKAREVAFTENGIRVTNTFDRTTTDQFFHYALITYTNTVLLRTFKSHGKRMYGMFEPTLLSSMKNGDRPETLFPLDKRFGKIDNIPVFPLLALLYRPDPPNNHLHCHAFACISSEHAHKVLGDIKARVKTFFEDYETLSVDDNIFSSPVADFWKLTDDGWRMTMTKKKRGEESENSEPEAEYEEIQDEERDAADLAVFAQATVASRVQSSTGELFTEHRVTPPESTEYKAPTSDSGVESPTTERPDGKPKPERPDGKSPRTNRDRPKYVRGGVRVLPVHSQNAQDEKWRPPVPPKPKHYKLVRQPAVERNDEDITQPEPEITEQESQTIDEVKKEEKPVENPVVEEGEGIVDEPGDADKLKDYEYDWEIETRPVDDWDWEVVGDLLQVRPISPTPPTSPGHSPEPGRFHRAKAIRRTSDACPKSPELNRFERAKPVRRAAKRQQQQQQKTKVPSFEGQVMMTKPQQLIDEENRKEDERKRQLYPRESDIENVIADLDYTNSIFEHTASMMNFERSLGYLP